MYHLIEETVGFIQNRIDGFIPEFGIVLGTGLSNFSSEIEVEYELMYSNIPNFSISTAEFHSGKLLFGKVNGRTVVAMQGRLHYYEGYSMQEITFPIRVMKELGIKKLFVSNASGSLNPEIKKGDICIIDDHINLISENPLRGYNDDRYGDRFPDMSMPYDRHMRDQALSIAQRHNIHVHSNVVYVSTSGPNLETRAEYKYMRIIGGDIVGMSTVSEVIVANHMSLPVFAISVVTDEGFHPKLQVFSLQEIVDVAMSVEPKITQVLKELIAMQ